MRKVYNKLSENQVKELKSIFKGGYSHSNMVSAKESNEVISSYDSTLCLYDYADIILGGRRNGKTKEL